MSTANSTLPAGTDNQAFCYDEQNRLTWAGSATTSPLPCGGSLTQGSLTAALYTQAFTYDTLGRLTASMATGGNYRGPVGAYSYGDPAHLHAATAIGTAWSGKYDAAGNLTCRAPSGGTTCPQTGTLTGAKLTFDVEGRLAAWQDTQTNPNTTVGFLYDNDGTRVAQQLLSGTTTTTTVYVGDKGGNSQSEYSAGRSAGIFQRCSACLRPARRALGAIFRSRHEVVLENIALRHQLEVALRRNPRPRLRKRDRILLVLLSRVWPGQWRKHLLVVRPETVIGWHRKGWRLYWTWRSRTRLGRPRLSQEVRALISEMSHDNPL